jgi:hypothetical protein
MASRGPLFELLAADHARLDALLSAALAPGGIERGSYDAFREGLLRHIAIEEKIVLPAAREARGGEPLPEARRLRIDHGAIAALLVPTPTPGIAAELRKILRPHNVVEEGEGGVYAACDALLAPQSVAIRSHARIRRSRWRAIRSRACAARGGALRVSALQSERQR